MRALKAYVVSVTVLVSFSVIALAQKPTIIDGTPLLAAKPSGDIDEAAILNEAAAATNVPLWSSHFTSGVKTYTYTMVGANPTTGNATTKIATVIIPLKFKFGSTIISPTNGAC